MREVHKKLVREGQQLGGKLPGGKEEKVKG
jgi:hypothetical protein